MADGCSSSPRRLLHSRRPPPALHFPSRAPAAILDGRRPWPRSSMAAGAGHRLDSCGTSRGLDSWLRTSPTPAVTPAAILAYDSRPAGHYPRRRVALTHARKANLFRLSVRSK